MREREIFELIEKRIQSIRSEKNKPIRVAINGIEGTGKTVFAGKLTTYLKSQSIKAIQVSIDGFHFNKKIRYQQGRDSARGYYEDSYDETSFVEKVLKSSQAKNPTITPATHDLVTDEYLKLPSINISDDTVLITDGAYLFKANYRKHWDLKIYLKTSFEVAMQRGSERDKNTLGGLDQAKEKFNLRYHKASKIYLAENQPEEIADLIIDNTDFSDLRILKESQ